MHAWYFMAKDFCSLTWLEIYRFLLSCCLALICFKAAMPLRLSAMQLCKHLMGQAVSWRCSCILAGLILAWTAAKRDRYRLILAADAVVGKSVPLCFTGTKMLPSSSRVNAALAVPVWQRAQIPLVDSCPRKQHNDLQVGWKAARGKRKEEEGGWESFSTRGMLKGLCVQNQSDLMKLYELAQSKP